MLNLDEFKVPEDCMTDAEQFEVEICKQVEGILKKPNHILANNFLDLNKTTDRIAAEIGVLGTLWAHFAWLEEIKTIQAETIEAEEYLKHKKAEPKDATETYLKKLVNSEKRYQKAKEELALTTKRKRTLDKMLDALQAKLRTIPGQQGASNSMLKGELRSI